jgi:hypothetical protein
MFDVIDFLERAGVDKYKINYRKMEVSNLSKEDLLRLMALGDDGSMVPVAFACGGWKFTTERADGAVP